MFDFDEEEEYAMDVRANKLLQTTNEEELEEDEEVDESTQSEEVWEEAVVKMEMAALYKLLINSSESLPSTTPIWIYLSTNSLIKISSHLIISFISLNNLP